MKSTLYLLTKHESFQLLTPEVLHSCQEFMFVPFINWCNFDEMKLSINIFSSVADSTVVPTTVVGMIDYLALFADLQFC